MSKLNAQSLWFSHLFFEGVTCGKVLIENHPFATH